MKTSVHVQTIYQCSLEQAFKTPILSDVTKVHTGFLIMPKVTHTSDEPNWGEVGSCKKIFVARSLTHKGAWASNDHILERIENSYWKIEVNQFQAWMLSFTKFVGEWQCTELASNQIQIDYTYTMHSSNQLLYPLNWLFTKLFWRVYMKQVLENIRIMIQNNEPYLYK